MKRKAVVWAIATLALVNVVAGAVWIWKPWAPPIVLADPGPAGHRIVEPGLFANYYPVDGEPAGAVLLLGGSEGGINHLVDHTARALQGEGFVVLALSYFGAPDQSKHLEHIPLETFDRALAWLRAQPGVPRDRVAAMGYSKGAEAALLVGTRDRGLRAVVAGAPSSAVWPGFNWDEITLNAGSSWSLEGEPLPMLPYASFHPAILLGDLGRLYHDVADRLPERPEAAIPIEETAASVLLVCGERDSIWPACPMSQQVKERADDAGGPDVRVLTYERGGHSVLGPPVPRGHRSYGSLGRWGGSSEDANLAREDAWPIVLDFLHEHLRP